MADPVPALRCECGRLLKLPESATGGRFRCPDCGRSIILKFEAAEETAETAPAPAAPEPESPEGTGEAEPEPTDQQQPTEADQAAAFAHAERLLLEESRFLRQLGYLPADGWVMTFQRPHLPPEQYPPSKPEELALCVGRQMQSDYFVPVILVVPVVESDPRSRDALRRALEWAQATGPVPVPLCLVTRGDRRRMFQTEGERPYDTLVTAEKAIGYLRGRSQRLAPELRLIDYPRLVGEIAAVLEPRGESVGFDGAAFSRDLKERFGTEDPDKLTLSQARTVTAELLEDYASRAPYQLLDIRFLTDEPAPEFERVGDIVREKLAFEEYQTDQRTHAKQVFNLLALGSFVAVLIVIAGLKLLAQAILVATLAVVVAQGRSRPIPPRLTRYVPPRGLLWDRPVFERAALAGLFLLAVLALLIFK